MVDGAGLDHIRCNDDWADLESRVVWDATAGREYLLMAGACCGNAGGHLELTIEPAAARPPRPVVDVTLARFGTLTSLGGAIIRGSVRCQHANRAFVSVEATQFAGRRIFRSSGGRGVDCGEQWRVRVQGGDFRLRAGTVHVRARATACNGACRSDSARRSVRIR